MIETRIYPSLIPIFPEREPIGTEIKEMTMCANQPFSFQMAYKITDESANQQEFIVRITSDIPISLYYVNCVPLLHTSSVKPVTPIGLYPDLLLPKQTNPPLYTVAHPWTSITCEKGEEVLLRAFDDSWQTLWLCINEKGKTLQHGTVPITIELLDREKNRIGEAAVTAEILPHKLPPQTLLYTNWFHHDCLADLYQTEVFSDRYFSIMEDYVKKASLNGMNMILLPAFTPPLDTPIGGERMTVQLVKVIKKGTTYEFDFSLMKRFITLCRKNGIRYFEHSHFFSQWGATATPKVVAEVNGKEKKIFGWNTKATGRAYVSFLRQYIPALKKFLSRERLEKKILFHISDEPDLEMTESYCAARNSIIDLLEGYPVGDAISHVEFYEQGLCNIPIPHTSSVHDFIGKCDCLWTYYTGGDSDEGKSNRLLSIARERNRMLGVQLYYYNIKGFLQWAYNFYYGQQSQYRFHPALNPCGGFPLAGTSYMVYPAFDGTAYQSVRQKIFGEGLNDIRLLTLLEKLAGRKTCEAIIHKYFGEPKFNQSPDCPETYLSFLDEVYQAIRQN